ncbi:MAG: hypothetical protein JO359_00295 [Candidatus Eremiobacteraeota bacterium]|nr:hypothetical protein [Candidatus Eremiobacteraeota bacterium]
MTAPVLIAALGASSLASVPLFASIRSEPSQLQGYSAPVHADVTLHKLFRFRFGLDGTISYKHPDRLDLTMNRVPPKYQRLFADLGTPRTWPATYNLQVTGSHLAAGRVVYELAGTPRRPSDVDHMTAEVSDLSTPVRAEWYLHDGGTIAMTIESQSVGDYIVPQHEQADIDVDGFKVHCDMSFGPYRLDERNVAESKSAL